MADRVESCPNSSVKRPRLENDPPVFSRYEERNYIESFSSFEAKDSGGTCGWQESDSGNLDHGRDAPAMFDSKDSEMYGNLQLYEPILQNGDIKDAFNGGDSGFNELSPASSSINGCHGNMSSTPADLANIVLDTLFDTGRDLGSISDAEDQPISGEIAGNHIDDDDHTDPNQDEVASTVSDISELSGMSGEDWKPTAGPICWVQRQMESGANPRVILKDMLPPGTAIPEHFGDLDLWKIIVNMVSEPPKRKKLNHINTLDDVYHLLNTCKKIIVLTGAGVSVSCGIPDFRSHDGIYARLRKDYPDLPDPQAMFDICYFKRNPWPFFKFAKEIYPGLFRPSPSHKFIKTMESHNKLLRNYTQNIDTLEQVAGIERVVQCHGSFATASCTRCKFKVDCEAIREDIMNQTIPRCSHCKGEGEAGIIKPDIVFFGESLSDEFHRQMADDKDVCDLLIVIGSSLKVRPVALIPSSVPAEVPQILINREPLSHMTFDVELLGDCDIIINELCHRLGWPEVCYSTLRLSEITELPISDTEESELKFSSMATAQILEDSSNMSITSQIEEIRPRTNGEILSENLCETAQKSEDCNEHMPNSRENKNMLANKKIVNPSKEEFPNLEHLKNDRMKKSVNNCESKDEDSIMEDADVHQDDGNVTSLHASRESKQEESIAKNLPENSYLFMPPNRYIFKGAEVYLDSDEEEDDEEDGNNSHSESEGDNEVVSQEPKSAYKSEEKILPFYINSSKSGSPKIAPYITVEQEGV